MAEELVSKEKFEAFTRRMERGFDPVNRRRYHLSADMRRIRKRLSGLYSIVRLWLHC